MLTRMFIDLIVMITMSSVALAPAITKMPWDANQRNPLNSEEFFRDKSVGTSGDKSGTSDPAPNRAELQRVDMQHVATCGSYSAERGGFET